MRAAFGLMAGFTISALGLTVVVASTQDLAGVLLIGLGVGVAALVSRTEPAAGRQSAGHE
jgi:hypothetical protein